MINYKDYFNNIDSYKNNKNLVYAYGAKYEIITEANIEKWKKMSPSIYTISYINKLRKDIGKIGIDCSGLVCKCLNINHIGSYQFYERYDKVKFENCKKGYLAWKKGHIGIITDIDKINKKIKVFEAKGIDYDIQEVWYNFKDFTIGLIPPVFFEVGEDKELEKELLEKINLLLDKLDEIYK